MLSIGSALVLAACSRVVLGLTPTNSSTSPLVTIDSGPIVGTVTSLPTATAPVNKFLGVPFANPPQRFSPPENVTYSSTVLNATAWKPSCIQQFQCKFRTISFQVAVKLISLDPFLAQQFTRYIFNDPAPAESEDCLYLNVYAPSTPAAGKGRAVMFWIYGGSLQFGTAGMAVYDGSAFAAYEDVIVVTTNYRTNVFGFPSSPELSLTGHNLGFLDQRKALDWVQRNIHAFGGDPDRVTIFGESAGAFSVDSLLTSYSKNSTPPFRAAILESGQYSYKFEPVTSSVPAWDNLTASLGCPAQYGDNLTCVRAANATTIKNIIEVNELTFNPVADNVTLVPDPVAKRLSGKIANIPVLAGTNSQEGR